MIREYKIQRIDGTNIFSRVYAKTVDIDNHAMFQTLAVAAKRLKEGEVERTDIVRYRFAYLRQGDLIFFVVLDRANTDEEAERAVMDFATSFTEKFRDDLEDITERQADSFEEEAKRLIKKLPVKLSIAGFGGVGKTTMTKLLRKEEVPLEYIPTIFGSRRPLAVGIRDYAIIIFDFAGQERFMAAWDILVKGTEVVLIVTDSTYGNVQRTKEQILPLILSKAPNAKIFVIANKQDLEGCLSPEEISRLLGYKAYPIVAIEPANRSKLLKIIEEAILA
ncbi:MAG: GTP-binding protein [Candidatus Ranarchaeia archaeon]